MSQPVPAPADDVPEILTNLDTRDDQLRGGFYVILFIIAYIIIIIWMLYLLIIHGIKLGQDFSGDNKKREILFAHRMKKNRALPDVTPMHRRINIFSYISMILMELAMVIGFLSFFAQSDGDCTMYHRFIIGSVALYKTFMYLVFLMRLQRLYEKGPFGYPTSCFFFFYAWITLFGIIVSIVIFVVMKAKVEHWNDDTNAIFANLCQTDNLTQWPRIAAVLLSEDIGVTVGFIWAYKIPLQKTYNAFKDKSPKIAAKIAYTGYKMVVLTSTAMLGSLICIGATAVTTTAILSLPDVIISSYCLMFMTSYYPDEQFYRRYCRCCILCCHSHDTQSNLEQALVGDLDGSYISADTGSQVRLAAAKLEVQLKNVSPTKQQIQLTEEKKEEKQDFTGNDENDDQHID